MYTNYPGNKHVQHLHHYLQNSAVPLSGIHSFIGRVVYSNAWQSLPAVRTSQKVLSLKASGMQCWVCGGNLECIHISFVRGPLECMQISCEAGVGVAMKHQSVSTQLASLTHACGHVLLGLILQHDIYGATT